jgi:hypothetical protein
MGRKILFTAMMAAMSGGYLACSTSPYGVGPQLDALDASTSADGRTGIDVGTNTPNLEDDAGAVRDASDGGALEPLYVALCVSKLASGDPEQALRFYTQVKAGAALELRMTPLLGWAEGAPVSPPTVSTTYLRGTPFVVTASRGQGGRFTASAGTVNLPGEANSVSGRALTITNLVLDGKTSGGSRFCSTLSGTMTDPYAYEFKASENTCLFVAVADGAALPKVPANEFVCPL